MGRPVFHAAPAYDRGVATDQRLRVAAVLVAAGLSGCFGGGGGGGGSAARGVPPSITLVPSSSTDHPTTSLSAVIIGAVASTWTIESGPAGPVISNPTSPATSVTFPM